MDVRGGIFIMFLWFYFMWFQFKIRFLAARFINRIRPTVGCVPFMNEESVQILFLIFFSLFIIFYLFHFFDQFFSLFYNILKKLPRVLIILKIVSEILFYESTGTSVTNFMGYQLQRRTAKINKINSFRVRQVFFSNLLFKMSFSGYNFKIYPLFWQINSVFIVVLLCANDSHSR